jgi:hypothetical protein
MCCVSKCTIVQYFMGSGGEVVENWTLVLKFATWFIHTSDITDIIFYFSSWETMKLCYGTRSVALTVICLLLIWLPTHHCLFYDYSYNQDMAYNWRSELQSRLNGYTRCISLLPPWHDKADHIVVVRKFVEIIVIPFFVRWFYLPYGHTPKVTLSVTWHTLYINI